MDRKRTRDGYQYKFASGHVHTPIPTTTVTTPTPPATSASRPRTLQERSSHDSPRPSAEISKHFVGNVGPGGNLYLRPSRLPEVHAHSSPTSPIDAIRPSFSKEGGESSNWIPKVRGMNNEHNVPVPPLSLANPARRRKTRSHSASNTSELYITAANAMDVTNWQYVRDYKDQRRKSSLEPAIDGLLNLNIPHYRLGTPHFGDRGSAYLNSIYTNSITDDNRSSVLTQQQYDRLFPMPPGSRAANAPAFDDSRKQRPQSNYWQSLANLGNTSVFDKIEANPNDPAIVRFSAKQPRLLAATIPRLVVQITSPRFLDYELLSDFFLTYRDFMSCQELLDWLIARMRWAMSNTSDTGRIVRVRTFVAMRHWILNYFADDFVASTELRRSLCESVNQLCRELSRRADSVGDLNVICELKKCWRRTSALFWPVVDAMDAGPLDNIYAGGEGENDDHVTDDAGKIKTLRQSWIDTYHRYPATSQLVALDRRSNQTARVISVVSNASRMWIRRSSVLSIPASPTDEDSLHIISCSIPFLSNIRPDSRAEKRAQRSAPRPVLPQRRNSLKDDVPQRKPKPPGQSNHQRGRSYGGSSLEFRSTTPIKPSSMALEEIPNIALTGGLVRGFILQPPSATVGVSLPKSPPVEQPKSHSHKSSEDYFDDDDGISSGVKRFVGDMRRALSVKKNSSEASSRSLHSHQNSSSQNSRTSNHLSDGRAPRSEPSLDAITNASSHSRKDILAARIEISYTKHYTDYEDEQNNLPVTRQSGFLDVNKSLPRPPSPGSWRAMTMSDIRGRQGSDITTRSRSIVIMDATSLPNSSSPRQMTASSQALQSSPLTNAFAQFDFSFGSSSRGSATDTSSQRYYAQNAKTFDDVQSLDERLHASLGLPPPLRISTQEHEGEGRSSSAQAEAFYSNARSPNQLRRRPGGDLRAADRVRELEPLAEPGASDPSMSGRTNSTATTIDASHNSASTIGKRDTLVRSASVMSSRNFHLPHRPLSQPLLSQRVQTQDLPQVREPASAGSNEDALARLEGKPHHRFRDSGTSWLEPPTKEEDEADARASDARKESIPIAFEMLTPTHAPDGLYRMSASSYSNGTSQSNSSQIASKNLAVPAIYSPTGIAAGSTSAPVLYPGSNGLSTPGDTNSQVLVSADAVQSSFLLADNESFSEDSADDRDGASSGVRSFYLDENTDGVDELIGPIEDPISLQSKNSTEKNKLQPPLKVATSAAKILGIPADTVVSEIVHTRSKSVKAILDEGEHMPFVLAFESDVIAEQLCIIEKDALDEIDWKDLIALNWQHSPPPVRNWVTYLNQEVSNGIDLVIARFNLVVKWVVSECILTQTLSERARCISKYIHIASHCLRLRNYASTYQITLALLSSDLARLRKTWSLVPAADRRILDRLERLCQPIHNFHNLRVDMENPSVFDGCIPFIGLYTHDLTYNAQKPAKLQPVPPSEITPPLINFERYQTAASITKGLLRLLEASSKYAFRPHPEALSRCLWLAALDDVDIREMGMQLE